MIDGQAQLAEAADALAECLGQALCALERLGALDSEELAGGRRMLLGWHQMRALHALP